jgi:hypothetical protein
MPMKDAMELFEYWAEFPPVHVLVRGYVGYQPPVKERFDPEQTLRMLSSSRGRNKKAASAPSAVRKMIEAVKGVERVA